MRIPSMNRATDRVRLLVGLFGTAFLAILIVLGLVISIQNGSGEDSPGAQQVDSQTSPAAIGEGQQAPTIGHEEVGAETRLLEIAVSDSTDRNLPADDMEIWVRGFGSWYPDLQFGGDGPQATAEFPAGELRTSDFYVYPDGREGSEILVEFRMMDDMISGSDQARTWVEIYDTYVEVSGQAIPGGVRTYDR